MELIRKTDDGLTLEKYDIPIYMLDTGNVTSALRALAPHLLYVSFNPTRWNTPNRSPEWNQISPRAILLRLRNRSIGAQNSSFFFHLYYRPQFTFLSNTVKKENRYRNSRFRLSVLGKKKVRNQQLATFATTLDSFLQFKEQMVWNTTRTFLKENFRIRMGMATSGRDDNLCIWGKERKNAHPYNNNKTWRNRESQES